MTKGISEKSKQLRRHLLNHNGRDVVLRMQKSGMGDPVGMIVEMTDDIGKQLTYAALEKQGMPKHEIPELIAFYCKNAIPTSKCVVSFETAMKILPITSETALQNLTAPRKPGAHWIVIVAGGGNSYAQVPASWFPRSAFRKPWLAARVGFRGSTWRSASTVWIRRFAKPGWANVWKCLITEGPPDWRREPVRTGRTLLMKAS